MITLGTYPKMSLDTARQQALKAMEMVMRGKDPEEKGIPTPEPSKDGAAASQTPTFDHLKEKASEKLDQFKDKASEQLDKIKAPGSTLDKFKEKATAKLDEIKQRVEKKVPHHADSKPGAKVILLDKKARVAQEKQSAKSRKPKRSPQKQNPKVREPKHRQKNLNRHLLKIRLAVHSIKTNSRLYGQGSKTRTCLRLINWP